MTTAGRVLKGIYSAAMAFLGGLATVLSDDVHIHEITDGQWVTLAAFTLGAFGGTYGLAGWAGPARLDDKP